MAPFTFRGCIRARMRASPFCWVCVHARFAGPLKTKIKYIYLRGTARPLGWIAPLLVAVRLEEIARLYWPFNNRGTRVATAPRDFVAAASVMKNLYRRDYEHRPFGRVRVFGALGKWWFIIVSFALCIVDSLCLICLRHGEM